MQNQEILIFFYGSYINKDVLAEVDYVPRRFETARLYGFEVSVRPLANIARSRRACVYGILATGTHDELARLYHHAEHVLGGKYLPEAVLVETDSEGWIPALTYISHDMESAPAELDYLQRIIAPAIQFGFPDWYIEHLNSFRNE